MRGMRGNKLIHAQQPHSFKNLFLVGFSTLHRRRVQLLVMQLRDLNTPVFIPSTQIKYLQKNSSLQPFGDQNERETENEDLSQKETT